MLSSGRRQWEASKTFHRMSYASVRRVPFIFAQVSTLVNANYSPPKLVVGVMLSMQLERIDGRFVLQPGDGINLRLRPRNQCNQVAGLVLRLRWAVVITWNRAPAQNSNSGFSNWRLCMRNIRINMRLERQVLAEMGASASNARNVATPYVDATPAPVKCKFVVHSKAQEKHSNNIQANNMKLYSVDSQYSSVWWTKAILCSQRRCSACGRAATGQSFQVACF